MLDDRATPDQRDGSASGNSSSCHEMACPPCPTARVTLHEAIQRFEREAVRGCCDTGRYRCSYYTWGEGPPLLIVPGLSDDFLSFVMLCFLLSRQFRCIAYDLPTGDGDGARLSRYLHSYLVADAFALLDHVEARRAFILGSSFGSTIALAALKACPDRLEKAVLQGGFARRRLAPAEILLAGFARYWNGTMKSLPLRRAALTRSHGEPFAEREKDVWEYFLTRWGSQPISATAYRALLVHRLDLRPLLHAIRQPVLLVCGDRDPLVRIECEEELLRGLPNAVRVELTGCGHNPQFTHPETLAQVVRRFLGESSKMA